MYVYVKIYAQHGKLRVVYRMGEHNCIEYCYRRGEKKNSLFISVYVGDYNYRTKTSSLHFEENKIKIWFDRVIKQV